MLNQARELAVQKRQEIIGAVPGASFQVLQELAPELEKFLTEWLFPYFWHRPQLDVRTRRFVTMTIFAVLKCHTQLESHIRSALQDGIPREEICEAFTHAAWYAGCPVAVEALKVAKKVFDEEDAKK